MRDESTSPLSGAVTLAGQVDQACDRFEADWKAGRRPRIEDYLERVSGEGAEVLLRELLMLEIELRRGSGDRPTLEEYLARFPVHDPLVNQALEPNPVDERIPDSESEASLARMTVAMPTGGDSLPAREGSVGASTSSGARFRVLRLHARGGLGEVYVARDEELHREVALKEIQDRYADNPDSRARFVQEAEITGGLEHPGIVPVYGLGHYADGRPFYAMRLIHGDSLKEAIERFHRADEPAIAIRASACSRCGSCWAASSTSATRSRTPTAAGCCTAT